MTRHALIIGIDKYPLLQRVSPSGQTVSKDLRGCVNDACNMAQLLGQRHGFAADNIRLLTDDQATRDGILAGLRWLLERVGPDELAVLFYAGHGSQMPDREKTKPSGWDETLVPYDSGRGAHPNRDITDDELRLWLLELASRTPYVTLIFDCCHSATLHRTANSDERSVDRDERPLSELPPSPLSPAQQAQLQELDRSSAKTSAESHWLPSSNRYVVLAACRERETAKEHSYSDGKQPAHAGALTFFLSEALRQAPADATYRDVFERTALEVSRRYPTQHPASEGALDRSIFGKTEHPTPTYVLVSKVQGDAVTLEAGEPQGVEPGSEYLLYPPGTRDFDGSSAAPRLHVTSVGPLSAQGRLAAPAEIAALWRAVLVQRPTETQWPVELLGVPELDSVSPEMRDNPRVPAIFSRKLLADSPWLRQVRPGEAPRARIQLGETWIVTDHSGGPLMKPLHLMQVARLFGGLEALARHQYVSELGNPRSPLSGAVDMQLLALEAAAVKSWRPLEPDAAVAPGTRLAVRLTSHHAADIYIALLLLEADAAITQLYPPVGRSEPFKAGGSVLIGDGEGAPIRARFPAELPGRAGAQGEAGALFKLLLTTQPVDLRRLLQQSETRSQGASLPVTDDWAAVSQRLRIVKDRRA